MVCLEELVGPDIGYDVVTKEAMVRSDVHIFVDWIVKAVKEDKSKFE
ncbi:hypothetical protein [Vibrio sp. VB16]|nr:hypothetical protein [Vibrio sp. VB16]UGA53795.1 hypothetical protein IUZ65_010875 [Vibrio sp. VB16]